jgi:tetratricopeptide (TPR) repeat protein
MPPHALEPVQVPAGFWQREDVLAALAARDVGALFRLLRQYTGASQTRIGIAVGMPQSEVSLIMSTSRRQRRVTALGVLARIADGLGIPDDGRRALGLAAGYGRDTMSADSDNVPSPIVVTEPQDQTTPSHLEHVDARERQLRTALYEGSAGMAQDPASVLAAADEVRQVLEDLIDDGTGPATRLERLEANADLHGRDALTVAPLEMICRLGLDMVDARHLVRTRRSDRDRRHIKRIAARLAALTADEMIVLGHVHAARAWYSTAVAAADGAGADELRADIRALSAMLPLYHGDAVQAATVASEAGALGQGKPCFAAALAPMLEGLAWAKAGQLDRARQALATARTAYDSIPAASHDETVFGFSPRRRFFYEGRLLTMLGDYQAAETAHRQALALYPTDVVGDCALISLDRAAALVATDEVDAAAVLVIETLTRLPTAHRTRLFLDTASNVINEVPARHRSLPTVRESREVLAELVGQAPCASGGALGD